MEKELSFLRNLIPKIRYMLGKASNGLGQGLREAVALDSENLPPTPNLPRDSGYQSQRLPCAQSVERLRYSSVPVCGIA